MRLCYDIEANGLCDREFTKKGELKTIADTVHCICIEDVDSGEQWAFGPEDLGDAITVLNKATVLIGHNIIGYDNRVMAKLLDWHPPEGCRMFDTLIVGRLMHPDRTQLPAGLGGQSLREWGWYLGNRKADYDGGWEQYSQEMLDYCVQDVATNVTIYKHQLKWAADNMKLINFEQRVAAICHEMASTGWGFDIDAARAYEQELVTSRAGLEDQLREAFPTIITERWSEKTGKRLKDGVEVFNPGSSKQWASRLGAKYKWKTEFTDAGAPIVDEPALRAAGFPETELGLEWRDINKKLGMLSDWILRADDGMIYGRTNSQGTATGRASHSQPNLAQVPSDPGCRVLFGPANREWAMVGCDLSGIELRCLAHYMAPFDDGAYAREILEGDIHTANQKAAGLPTRNDAKTFIYALIYGAGDGKLGSIVDGSAKVGKGLRGRFFAAIPALATLIEKAQFKAQKAGELKLLDGRAVPIRAARKSLNTLLQGAGAVISKAWLVIAIDMLEEAVPGQYQLHGWIHDELQCSAHPDVAEQVGDILSRSATIAGERLGFNMRVDAEYSIGTSWKDTH